MTFEPVFEDDLVTLFHGDCLDVMKQLPDNSVHAVVTDPPYGLGFMGKEWDGLPPGEPWARECLRVLKPGGHLLAFGGTRTYHRLAVAIEDAGFEIRDSITWLYGSGFPKSLDVSKAIDKAAGVAFTSKPASGVGFMGPDGPGGYNVTVNQLERAGESTADAQQWAGWGTALKPASEPIVVARKPLTGTVAQSVLEHGTGALNIDGTRVAHASAADLAESESKNRHAQFGTEPGQNKVYGDFSQTPVADYDGAKGRWPANVVITHLPECEQLDPVTEKPVGGGAKGSSGFVEGYAGDGFVGRPISTAAWHCADGCPARELDKQSGVQRQGFAGPQSGGITGGMFGGERKVSAGTKSGEGSWSQQASGQHKAGSTNVGVRDFGDVGGASRYFPSFRYEAKAPTTERPLADGVGHPTVKPLDLMRWLVRLVCPPGGVVLEPFAGSGTTAEACVIEGLRCIAIEREAAYLPLIRARLTKPIQPDLFGAGA